MFSRPTKIWRILSYVDLELLILSVNFDSVLWHSPFTAWTRYPKNFEDFLSGTLLEELFLLQWKSLADGTEKTFFKNLLGAVLFRVKEACSDSVLLYQKVLGTS